MGQLTDTVVVSVVILLLQSKFGEAEISKSCSGATKQSCKRHNLRCGSGQIAIQEAFYVNRACLIFFNALYEVDCESFNVNNMKLTHTTSNFSDTELATLYKSCSRQSSCSYPAVTDFTYTFSAITYHCVNEIIYIHVCDITSIQRTDTSLIWSGPNNQNTCMCSISKSSTSETTLLTLTALEIRDHCPSFTISVDGEILHIPCSQFTPGYLLFNSTSWLDVTLSFNVSTTTNNSDIWIRIQGTDMLYIVCNEPTTTTLTETAETTAAASSTTRTGFTGVFSLEQKSETSNEIGGVFAAGLFTGLGLAAVFVGVVYFVYIRRRCVMKNLDPGPASLSDRTYSGLKDRGPPDTYDVINQPKDGSNTSESSEAPVYQNVAGVS